MSKRLLEYRKKLFKAIEKALREEGHHKSGEGQMTVSFDYQNYFESEIDTPPRVTLRVFCYVLGPHRLYDYSGSSLDECLDKAEVDLDSWIWIKELES